MQAPRPVPPIARGPQQFATSAPAPMPVMIGGQQPMTAAEDDPEEDLAMEIYCRIIATELTTGITTDDMRRYAKRAKQAAAIYFEQENPS